MPEKTKRIFDKEVYDVINAVERNEEECLKKATITLLRLAVDIRILLRKIYISKKSKIYTDPTKTISENDVVIGEEA